MVDVGFDSSVYYALALNVIKLISMFVYMSTVKE